MNSFPSPLWRLFGRIGFGSFTMVPPDEILAAEIRHWRVGIATGSVALGIGILRGGLVYRLIGQLYLCFLAYETMTGMDLSAAVHLSSTSPKPVPGYLFMIEYGAMFWLLSDVGIDKDKSTLGAIALLLSLLSVVGFYLQSP